MRPVLFLPLCLSWWFCGLPEFWLLPHSELPPVYDVPWAPEPVKIDGLPDDPSWASAPWSDPFMDIRGAEYPSPTFTTRFKAVWDDFGLYILADIEDPDIWGTLSQRDAIIYRDDDFEIFLDPHGNGLEYFEIEVNALGTILDLYLPEPYSRGGRARIEWDATRIQVGVHHRGTLNDPSDRDQGWMVELFIPWTDLVPPEEAGRDVPAETASGRFPWVPGTCPLPGTEWRVNFSRVDWPLEIVPGGSDGSLVYEKAESPTRQDPHPEANWVWSPQGVIDMHLPEMWGIMRFLGPEEGGGQE
jgi:hypothetical protein